MRFYYTGSSSFNLPQTDPSKSLGGYKSSTPVPNARLNELFGEISLTSKDITPSECVAIVLANDSEDTLVNVSLTAIYESLFGQNDCDCEYEIAPVSLNNNQLMEVIGSRLELPYYAEFYKPFSTRAFAVVKFLTPATIGDTITILGQTFLMTGNTIESMVNNINDQYDTADFKCSKKSSSELFFERKLFGQFANPVTIATLGLATIQPVSFSGGANNSLPLSASFEPNEAIGIWIKRTFKKKPCVSCSELELKTDCTTDKEKTSENLEMIVTWGVDNNFGDFNNDFGNDFFNN